MKLSPIALSLGLGLFVSHVFAAEMVGIRQIPPILSLSVLILVNRTSAKQPTRNGKEYLPHWISVRTFPSSMPDPVIPFFSVTNYP